MEFAGIRSDTSTGDIVFPDESEENTFPEVNLNTPPNCAKGSTFCEDFDSYPYDELQSLLRRSVDPKIFFGDEDGADELNNRIGEPEEHFVCAAVDKTIYPRVGKTRNNEWKVIVNQRDQEGYIQGIRVEICGR